VNSSIRLRQPLEVVLALTLGLVMGGTLGYILIEGWSWEDALFMTVTTLATVGYGEVNPLTSMGRLFTMLLILSGVGVLAYSFAVICDYLIAGELNGMLRRQRMKRVIGQLQHHYIICGFGRVGQQVVEGLRANGHALVVIDSDPDYSAQLDQWGVAHIEGDATDDQVLQQAGIERARGLCTCLPNDAANVFIVLSARTLNPGIFIIARGNQPASERKLRIAGANQVINPYQITGHRMAALLLHPGVVEFLDVIMRRGELELRIEEITIGPTSDLNGRSLADSRVRSETGVNVLAVRRRDGKLCLDLHTDLRLEAGDALIGLGTEPQLAALAGHAHDNHQSLKLMRSG
jgi:voltage-gated potassium channel